MEDTKHSEKIQILEYKIYCENQIIKKDGEKDEWGWIENYWKRGKTNTSGWRSTSETSVRSVIWKHIIKQDWIIESC